MREISPSRGFLVFLSYPILSLFCGKMDKLLYFSNGSTNFYEILNANVAILKNVKCDISAAVYVQPILMKFGTMMHLSPPNVMGNQKFSHKAEDWSRGIEPTRPGHL